MNNIANTELRWKLFRIGLLATAASLAGYIPYKYVTQLHSAQGLYGFMFPLSAVLAAAGIVLALRPTKGCDCSVGVRVGVGLLAGLWLVTGVVCVPALAESIAKHPVSGLFATFQMFAQHVFLSLAILAFAIAPRAMATRLSATDGARSGADEVVAAAGSLSGD